MSLILVRFVVSVAEVNSLCIFFGFCCAVTVMLFRDQRVVFACRNEKSDQDRLLA